ncbi:MAG: uroporphyrinogen decarboxylase family protein [Bacteroidota bacterium]
MTTRERLKAVFNGDRPDRLPNVEFGYWDETFTLWHKQGLPSTVTSDAEAEEYLGLEGVTIWVELPVKTGLFPEFEPTVLREEGDRQIIRDVEGNICEVLRDSSSIPRYVEFGLKTKADWDRLKEERLDPDAEGRIGDIESAVREAEASGRPIIFRAGSLYGWLRNWMGVEGLSVALMTEREWVEEMMDHFTELTLRMIDRALPGMPVDLAWWWEDMCYNKGPLMSPKMFQEMLVPRYRRVTGALRKQGVEVNLLDCDGRINELVPGWLEAGIKCMFPLEAAHTDAYVLREEFGDQLLLIGGVNKLALIAGKESIDKEIQRLLPLVEKGRFLPCLDHRVPADVTFENYRYYLKQKKLLLNS